MKYLLHGDDITSSRKFLTDTIDSFQSTVLDGKSLQLKDLELHLASTSLFDDKKAVVIENLLGKNPKKKEIAKFLSLYTSGMLIVLWEDKKIPKTTLNMLKDFVVKDFNLPSYYFQFLDSIAPKNGKKLFVLYQSLLTTITAEQIFFSLLKRVRLLLVLSSHGTSQDLEKMAPWQKQKLSQQVRMWNTDMLQKFYYQLTDIEIKLKSGRLALGLSKHLDTLILSQLI